MSDLEEQSANVGGFYRRLKKFNQCMDYTFALPMTILERIIDNIVNLTTTHTISCALCLCATVTATISATTIAVGVGIGVGIGCSKLNLVYTNSTNG